MYKKIVTYAYIEPRTPVQPSTLCEACGLSTAAPSRDITPPVSRIAAVADSLPWGVDGRLPQSSVLSVGGLRTPPAGRVNVTVAAWEVAAATGGSGAVAAVEVSLDGGKRWHPARRVPRPWPQQLVADPPAGADTATASVWSLEWGHTMHDWVHAEASTFLSHCQLSDNTECSYTVEPLARAVDDSLNMEAS